MVMVTVALFGNCLPERSASRAALMIIVCGPGLMAGFPTGTASPGLVTVPTPSPPLIMNSHGGSQNPTGASFPVAASSLSLPVGGSGTGLIETETIISAPVRNIRIVPCVLDDRGMANGNSVNHFRRCISHEDLAPFTVRERNLDGAGSTVTAVKTENGSFGRSGGACPGRKPGPEGATPVHDSIPFRQQPPHRNNALPFSSP